VQIMTDVDALSGNTIVEAREIHKIYDTGKVKARALNGVTLSIEPGRDFPARLCRRDGRHDRSGSSRSARGAGRSAPL
jgi:hypothetical protein